jgi:peptide/nickel transport system substrate-binding protein
MNLANYFMTINPVGLTGAARQKYIHDVNEHLRWIWRTKSGRILLNCIKRPNFPVEIRPHLVGVCNAVGGGDIQLNIMDQGAYYGDAVFGKSPWLDSDMGITDYGHRGVPNVYLSAPLTSEGTWNSAHFKNAEYDGLVKSYFGALDLESQRGTAKKIQELLLDETPLIFSYFYDFLTVQKKGATGVSPTAMGHLLLGQASL